jgi:AraC family L-rhamnose operon regulatory protein RhaS
MAENDVGYYNLDMARKSGFHIAFEGSRTFNTENDFMFQLVIVESGTGIININGKSIVFMAPTVFCLSELDKFELVKQYSLKARAIFFNSIIVSSSLTREKVYDESTEWSTDQELQEFFYLAPFLHRDGDFLGKIDVGISILKKMVELYGLSDREIGKADNEFWRCRSRSYFLEILLLIQYAFTNSESMAIELPRLDHEMDEVILYIYTNYNRKISIKELTTRFHIDRTTLNRKFNNSTGMSVKEYLTRLRIKVAAMMLRDTALPISEILYRSGFNDTTYFGRAFKKYMIVSPSDYRKNYVT